MNSNPQLDLHPDAESLNAFVEQMLPEKERGQILVHLAECGRCRQVVYLAQEAAAEMEMEPELELAVAAATTNSDVRKDSRFRNWRFAWVPAGALAVVATAAYVVHVRRVEIAAEQTKIARESAARNVEMASTPQAPPMGMQGTSSPAAPSASKRLKSELPSTRYSNQLTSAAVSPSVSDSGAMANSSSDEAVPPGTSGSGSSAMGASAEYEPAPAPAAKLREQERAAGAFQSRSMAVGKPPLPAAAPIARTDAGAREGGSAEAGAKRKQSGTLALYDAEAVALPSGLPAVSTEIIQGRKLAVDEAGGVFLSEEAGGHWESIAKQWSGRAVVIRVEPSAGSNASAKPSPAAVFEIVNDQGQAWVSTNGRIWKAK